MKNEVSEDSQDSVTSKPSEVKTEVEKDGDKKPSVKKEPDKSGDGKDEVDGVNDKQNSGDEKVGLVKCEVKLEDITKVTIKAEPEDCSTAVCAEPEDCSSAVSASDCKDGQNSTERKDTEKENEKVASDAEVGGKKSPPQGKGDEGDVQNEKGDSAAKDRVVALDGESDDNRTSEHCDTATKEGRSEAAEREKEESSCDKEKEVSTSNDASDSQNDVVASSVEEALKKTDIARKDATDECEEKSNSVSSNATSVDGKGKEIVQEKSDTSEEVDYKEKSDTIQSKSVTTDEVESNELTSEGKAIQKTECDLSKDVKQDHTGVTQDESSKPVVSVDAEKEDLGESKEEAKNYADSKLSEEDLCVTNGKEGEKSDVENIDSTAVTTSKPTQKCVDSVKMNDSVKINDGAVKEKIDNGAKESSKDDSDAKKAENVATVTTSNKKESDENSRTSERKSDESDVVENSNNSSGVDKVSDSLIVQENKEKCENTGKKPGVVDKTEVENNANGKKLENNVDGKKLENNVDGKKLENNVNGKKLASDIDENIENCEDKSKNDSVSVEKDCVESSSKKVKRSSVKKDDTSEKKTISVLAKKKETESAKVNSITATNKTAKTVNKSKTGRKRGIQYDETSEDSVVEPENKRAKDGKKMLPKGKRKTPTKVEALSSDDSDDIPLSQMSRGRTPNKSKSRKRVETDSSQSLATPTRKSSRPLKVNICTEHMYLSCVKL